MILMRMRDQDCRRTRAIERAWEEVSCSLWSVQGTAYIENEPLTRGSFDLDAVPADFSG